MSKWTLVKASPPFPSPLHECVHIWNNSIRKHERMGELSATPAMAQNLTKVGLHADTAQLPTQGRSTSASSTTQSATWIDTEGDSPRQDRTSPRQDRTATACLFTSNDKQQDRVPNAASFETHHSLALSQTCAHRCELTSRTQQQRRPVHDGEGVWCRKDRKQTQPPDHPTATRVASSSTPFSSSR